MWRRLDLVWTYVSEECIVSIFRVEKIREREQVAADYNHLLVPHSRISVLHTISTRRYNQENGIHHILTS
jgi:hypothetical protein